MAKKKAVRKRAVAPMLPTQAQPTDPIADQLDSLKYHVEKIADEHAILASETGGIAMALAAWTIAQHGSPDDKRKIVEHLKSWFWKSEIFTER